MKSELNVKGKNVSAIKEQKRTLSKCGAYVDACDKEEIKILDQLKNRADKRNIRSINIWSEKNQRGNISMM